MLKNILKLEGAQKLTKNEQKSINGGAIIPVCPSGSSARLCPDTTEYICLKKGEVCMLS
jgi:hypothetical protein